MTQSNPFQSGATAGAIPMLDLMYHLATNGWTVSILGPRHDLTWEVHVSKRLYFREIAPYFASGKALSTDPAYALARAQSKAEADLSAILDMPNPRPEPVRPLRDLLASAVAAQPRPPVVHNTNLRRFG